MSDRRTSASFLSCPHLSVQTYPRCYLLYPAVAAAFVARLSHLWTLMSCSHDSWEDLFIQAFSEATADRQKSFVLSLQWRGVFIHHCLSSLGLQVRNVTKYSLVHSCSTWQISLCIIKLTPVLFLLSSHSLASSLWVLNTRLTQWLLVQQIKNMYTIKRESNKHIKLYKLMKVTTDWDRVIVKALKPFP